MTKLELNVREIADFINEYVKRGTYRLLGENYPYSGPVKTKPQGQQNTYVVGYWKDGSLEIWKDNLWVDEREFDVPNDL